MEKAGLVLGTSWAIVAVNRFPIVDGCGVATLGVGCDRVGRERYCLPSVGSP